MEPGEIGACGQHAVQAVKEETKPEPVSAITLNPQMEDNLVLVMILNSKHATLKCVMPRVTSYTI